MNHENIKEDFIYNLLHFLIFDTIFIDEKKFIGLQGYDCDVILTLGDIEIKCFDHLISCYLIHSNISKIELKIKPHINAKNWYVKMFWDDKATYTNFIIDITLDEILATIEYIYNGIIKVNFESHIEKNNINKIIKELSNKHFLNDIEQEKKVIDILQKYYNDYKIII